MSARSLTIWPVLGRKEINERSEQSFTVRFLDNRALSAPDVARYRLKHVGTGEIVKAWTAIGSPTSEETVVISSDLNKIRAGCASETYELVVQSDYDDFDKKQTEACRYKVINLSSVDN